MQYSMLLARYSVFVNIEHCNCSMMVKSMYYENVSKNQNGSFKQLHINSKVVPVFPCPEAGDRCPVRLLDLYISKLPTDVKENDLLYVWPLDKKPQDPWYSAVPLGKHTSAKIEKDVCRHRHLWEHNEPVSELLVLPSCSRGS